MFCLKSTEVCLKEVRCFQFPKPIHPLGKKFCVFLLHSYTNSWKSVYTLGISGVGKGVGCCPGVGLILHFPSGYGISLINLFTFRKLNQRISACVQGTPRKGNMRSRHAPLPMVLCKLFLLMILYAVAFVLCLRLFLTIRLYSWSGSKSISFCTSEYMRCISLFLILFRTTPEGFPLAFILS